MNTRRALVRPIAVLCLAFAIIGSTLSLSTASATTTWKPRAAQYPDVVTQRDLAIRMSDGVILRGDVVRPADASGQAINKRLPVIVTITAYNKTVLASSSLGGSDPTYLVKRGYVQLTVDARGTGSSEGVWQAFGARENTDAGEIMTWAHSSSRPWSNGITGMTGPSYMGISQLWAAAAHPAGLKAIFPQVPGADVYRDVVASGGQLDVGFIPLWLGLVTGTGLIPPAAGASDPQSGMKILIDRLMTAGTFTAPLLAAAVTGQDPVYDGPFYKERSLINVIGRVNVPTFFVSGEYDLFQRGTPLLFENLNKRGIPAKMIIGPWDHLQASSGAEIPRAGYGTLSELQLRWFDHYLKGVADTQLNSDIANLTYHEIGTGAWRKDSKWIGSSLIGSNLKLSGTSALLGEPGGLTSSAAVEGKSDILPIPVSGLCTRSANQWTAGAPNAVAPDFPCFKDNALNDKSGVVFSTQALTKPITLQGPIDAHLFTSSVGGDGLLSVAIEDEAPDGTVNRISGGWQVISHRALITAKSRYLGGKLIQPFHPFTKATQKPLASGEIAPIDVEIFPTRAKILAGHKLRIAVQAFDVPHLLPSLPGLVSTLTIISIHNSAKYPSTVNFPSVGTLPTVR